MNMNEIINAMELSGIAYHDVQPSIYKDKITVISDPKTDVQCYLRRDDSNLYITFRGSNSKLDWKTNMKYNKMAIPYGNNSSKIRVHSGFLEAYKSKTVRAFIHSEVSKDINTVKITGHSQGAALAILCGVDLEYNFPKKIIQVIVFGCPRVGNKDFKKSYNKRVFNCFRITNGNDIVTKVPTAFMGFRHVGMNIHIGSPSIFGIFSFKDHYPQEYYKNLIKKTLSH